MKLESLKNALFTPVKKSELKEVKGGGYSGTSGTGTITIRGVDYSWDGDVNDGGGHIGYWVPKLVQYYWPT